MIDGFIILLAALLRLIGLSASSIWYDEAFSLALSKLPWLEIARLQAMDFNPPLWELLISLAAPYFGLLGARVIALALSICSMLVLRAILIDIDIRDEVRWLILLSVGAMPGMVWTSQDARPYSLLMFLFLLAVWLVINLRWLGAAACMGLMIFTHTAAPFYILGIYSIAVYLWSERPDTAKWLAWSTLIIVGCNLVWPYGLLRGLTRAGDFWLGPLDPMMTAYSWSMALFASSIPDAPAILLTLAIGLLALISIPRLISGIKDYDDAAVTIFGLLFIVPFTAMLGFSIAFHNMIFYRPLILLVIPLIAWLIISASRMASLISPLITITLLALVPIYTAYQFDPAERGGHVDAAAKYISDNWESGDQIYYSDGAIALPFDNYLRDYPHRLLVFSGSGAGLGNPVIMREFNLPGQPFIATAERTWLVWHREDEILGAEGTGILSNFARSGIRVMTLTSPQFARVEIYLIPFNRERQ